MTLIQYRLCDIAYMIYGIMNLYRTIHTNKQFIFKCKNFKKKNASIVTSLMNFAANTTEVEYHQVRKISFFSFSNDAQNLRPPNR